MGGQQWELSEFDNHLTKLDGVLQATQDAAGKASGLGMGGLGMYGILPGPLIVPALNILNRNIDDVLKALVEANEMARDGIKTTRDLNADTEATNRDHTQEIIDKLNEIEGKI